MTITSIYVRSQPIKRSVQPFDSGIKFKKRITVFMGENGIGKSTLLEAIAAAYGFNPEGGTRNFSFSTYNSHSELYSALRLSRGGYPKDGFFLRAERFFTKHQLKTIQKIEHNLAYMDYAMIFCL